LAERPPEDGLTREREHLVDGLDDVVTEDLGGVEVEVAQEADRAHADRERMRLREQTHRHQRVLARTLEQEPRETNAADDDIGFAHALCTHDHGSLRFGAPFGAPPLRPHSPWLLRFGARPG
jgi:hypothetical protein